MQKLTGRKSSLTGKFHILPVKIYFEVQQTPLHSGHLQTMDAEVETGIFLLLLFYRKTSVQRTQWTTDICQCLNVINPLQKNLYTGTPHNGSTVLRPVFQCKTLIKKPTTMQHVFILLLFIAKFEPYINIIKHINIHIRYIHIRIIYIYMYINIFMLYYVYIHTAQILQ